MASALARRIARLEQGRAAVVPNVIEVAIGETDEQAIERFVVQAKHISSGISGRLRAGSDHSPTRGAVRPRSRRRGGQDQAGSRSGYSGKDIPA